MSPGLPQPLKNITEIDEALQQAIDRPLVGSGALPTVVFTSDKHGPLVVMRAIDLTAVLVYLERNRRIELSLS